MQPNDAHLARALAEQRRRKERKRQLANTLASHIDRERDQAAEGLDGATCPRCKRPGGEVRKRRRDRISMRCAVCGNLWRSDGEEKAKDNQASRRRKRRR